MKKQLCAFFFSQKKFLKGFTSFFVNKEDLKNNYKTFLKEFFILPTILLPAFFYPEKYLKKQIFGEPKLE
jgi:hypothetical protein